MAEIFGSERRIAVCRELTNLRGGPAGTVGELASQVEDILGEVTLVVEGAPARQVDPSDLVAEVEARVDSGMRRSGGRGAGRYGRGVSRRGALCLGGEAVGGVRAVRQCCPGSAGGWLLLD